LKKKEAAKIVHGLSSPSKMPCHGYSIPAQDCKTGSRLVLIPGSVCHGCYALKGNYTRYPAVKTALQRRLLSLKDPRWVESMITLIKGMPYFRWHDSGDIQDLDHLHKILLVVKGCPETKFWLPTREYEMVETYHSIWGAYPDNLSLRLSAHMIDKPGPTALAIKLGVQTSTVKKTNYSCPASKTDNKCADCRNCWDTKIMDISYKLH